MNGRDVLLVVAGAGVGVLVAMQLRDNEASCCRRVADAARDMAGEVPVFGGILQRLGDTINLWPHVPPLLDLFGVD
jgi:uncharacterized membrane protein